MARLVAALAVVLALAAAAAAALIVAPAPSFKLALAAIAAGEKSVYIAGTAVLAIILAFIALRPGTRLLGTLAILLALGAFIVSLIPPAQALRLATEQRVSLDWGRYLRSQIDSEGQGSPDDTVTYNKVEGRDLTLDVYRPRGGAAGTPTRAILVLHGGGWSAGAKGDATLASRRLADRGFTVFDVEYRLGPQPNWTAAVGDVKCAIGYVKQHASGDKWNVDPARITLLGRSAGAHLALLAAYAPSDDQLPAACEAGDTSVVSVVSYYGVADLVWAAEHPPKTRVYDLKAKIRDFTGAPLAGSTALYQKLSPIHQASESSPRTLLIHGGRDQLIPAENSQLLADRLSSLGVKHDLLVVPYAQHSFDFIVGGLSGQIAETAVLRFLAR